ncbi:BEL1-like homeodomain protein 1 [Nicotiana tomentosiformis]|uniref:BEL1-like homeodomain protein 1 n=1 Tax=Nicotiana tomentosiformis TaxID=4098 RepID=UPI00051C8305|nr:BEL1-like homeodomain protein 1 [Nicotiana tomentosiformis]XP_009628714.1 BEL1-like homeodomain protein 1 [Nicotiana tomentosiformis]XP_009628715.1 BEL1-like homeodomain protein 1 [Nicotiana tomentosiformis]
MAAYFDGNSEIQGGNDGLQTLILMNPAGYVGFSETQQPPAGGSNLVFFNSNPLGNSLNLPHARPSSQQQQFVGIPLATSVFTAPSSFPDGTTTPTVHSQHDISALHGFLARSHEYGFYNPSNDIMEAREVTRAQQQGLSLSLSSQQPGFGNFRPEREELVTTVSPTAGGGSSSSVQSVPLSPKYLKAAQELLDEVVNVGKAVKTSTTTEDVNYSQKSKNNGESSGNMATAAGQEGGETNSKRDGPELSAAERQEIQMKKAKLVNMLDEVEQRYRHYHQQMQSVISWLEQAAGIGSAKTYTALALKTISKQFRCLKDAITGQIRSASKTLGEDDSFGGKIEGSRLKFVDNQIRQQRALQQLGMIQHNAWRPQRGLPERAVSVLRAWLFEHFLHPYPRDSDKMMLAKQTGLTRSQVSNWFINARVRLWKPMVEEMYLEEIKEQEQNGSDLEKTSKLGEQNEDSTSRSIGPQEKSPRSDSQNKSFLSKHDNNLANHNPASTIPKSNTSSISPTGLSIRNNTGFNLIGSPEKESINVAQGSQKKPRSNEMLHSPNSVPSINMDVKPNEEQMSIKFGDDRQNRDGFSLMGGPTNFMGGFGSYPIGEIGRFSTEQFSAPYSTSGTVSLTLGLPHSENLSMSATHHSFLPIPTQSIQMGRGVVEIGEANEFGSLNTPTSAHSTSVYENFNIQNRKRFAAPLLPDFVA